MQFRAVEKHCNVLESHEKKTLHYCEQKEEQVKEYLNKSVKDMDIKSDGKVTSADALAIFQNIVGLD